MRGQSLQSMTECMTIVQDAAAVLFVLVFFDDMLLDLEAVVNELIQPVRSEALGIDDSLELFEAVRRPREHQLEDLAIPRGDVEIGLLLI